MRRLVLALAVAMAAVALTAAPAAAHADLVRTAPAAGDVLAAPPSKIDLLFTEDVDASLGAVEVFDAEAKPVKTGPPQQLDGRNDGVTVSMPSDLPFGTYVVTWRVVSGDSHPIHGAFTFIVGTGTAPGGHPQALERGLLEADSGSRTVGIVSGAARFLSYASLIVLIGGLFLVLVLWPAGRSVRTVRGILGGAWCLAVLATVAGIAIQGVYAAGLPLSDVFDWSVISDVLDTRFGRAWGARLLLLLLAVPLLRGAMRSAKPVKPGNAVLLGAMALSISVTGGIAGHPGTDHPAAFTVGLDGAHFAAISLWLGGLTLLCLVVLRRGSADTAGEVVPRFSRLALASVVVVVITGTIQGWWQVRSLDALTDSTYGRLLLTKVGLFAGIILLASFARAWVKHRAAAPEPALVAAGPGAMAATPDIGKLRRTVAGEAVIAVAVLAVTAVLVNTVPGRVAVSGTDSVEARDAFVGPFRTELHTAQVRLDVGVDPARVGTNEIHVYTLTHGGEAADVEEVRARITLTDRGIGPLEVNLQRVGPGHVAAYAYFIPLPGLWLLEVTARTSDISQSKATTPMQINP